MNSVQCKCVERGWELLSFRAVKWLQYFKKLCAWLLWWECSSVSAENCLLFMSMLSFFLLFCFVWNASFSTYAFDWRWWSVCLILTPWDCQAGGADQPAFHPSHRLIIPTLKILKWLGEVFHLILSLFKCVPWTHHWFVPTKTSLRSFFGEIQQVNLFICSHQSQDFCLVLALSAKNKFGIASTIKMLWSKAGRSGKLILKNFLFIFFSFFWSHCLISFYFYFCFQISEFPFWDKPSA